MHVVESNTNITDSNQLTCSACLVDKNMTTSSGCKHYINGNTATIAGLCILQEQPMSCQMIVASFGTSQMNNCYNILICIAHRVYHGNSAPCSQRWITHFSPPFKGSKNLQNHSCCICKDRSMVAYLAGKVFRVGSQSYPRSQYNSHLQLHGSICPQSKHRKNLTKWKIMPS